MLSSAAQTAALASPQRTDATVATARAATAPAAPQQASADAPAPADELQRKLSLYREALLDVSVGSEAALDETLAQLRAVAAANGAGVTVMRLRGGGGADVLVRKLEGETQTELRIAVIGNVDAGKSTLISVLVAAQLDDGRGAARRKILHHPHEQETGRTSSISQHSMLFAADGASLTDATHRAAVSEELVNAASKIVTLVDLCGHERYLRTTCFGLTGHKPDFGLVIVGANAGLVGMCKEHVGIALALHVPTFYVVSKIDFAPEEVCKATVQDLVAILKKPGVRKRPFIVRTEADVFAAAHNMASDTIAPIFLVSAVDGRGIDRLRLFINLLPQRTAWGNLEAQPATFVIDETFAVPGVGTVVAGTLTAGVLTSSTSLLLGPDPTDGQFKPAAIKTIHYKRVPAVRVVAGQAAALALKKVKRGAVRKGMVLVSPQLHPQAAWEFEADIAILTHSSTIAPRYQAVVHVGVVRQTAMVVSMSCELLRSGDRAKVRWRFLQRPEFVPGGVRFIFREGRTKGVGVVLPPEATPQ